MSILGGILAELGIEKPLTHWKSNHRESKWHVGEKFIPVEGECYELVFGNEHSEAEDSYAVKRVKINGQEFGRWFDLDEEQPLDRKLRGYEVRAFRQL
jgi:hypothetical protein